jgi:hypothetical protein
MAQRFGTAGFEADRFERDERNQAAASMQSASPTHCTPRAGQPQAANTNAAQRCVLIYATRLLIVVRRPLKGDLMISSATNSVKALGLVAIGVAIAAAGIYIGDTDDAPGAALIGILLMIGAVTLGVRTARRKA